MKYAGLTLSQLMMLFGDGNGWISIGDRHEMRTANQLAKLGFAEINTPARARITAAGRRARDAGHKLLRKQLERAAARREASGIR